MLVGTRQHDLLLALLEGRCERCSNFSLTACIAPRVFHVGVPSSKAGLLGVHRRAHESLTNITFVTSTELYTGLRGHVLGSGVHAGPLR